MCKWYEDLNLTLEGNDQTLNIIRKLQLDSPRFRYQTLPATGLTSRSDRTWLTMME